MFCSKVRTDQGEVIVHTNECGRLTVGPTRGNGGEISAYRPERRFLTKWEYTREVARQWQQGGGVDTPAAPYPPQPQRFPQSQQFQRASARVTAFRSGIARQLLLIDGYYSGRSTRMEGKEEGNKHQIEELSDEDEGQVEGQGECSAEEQE